MWQRRHPLEVDRDAWLHWLDQRPHASPYLLPEWSLFWERVWPAARAEFWIGAGQTSLLGGVPVVRRRRWGLEWVFSQPFGTPGGWIGQPGANPGDDFLCAIASPRTVEIAVSSSANWQPPTHWFRETITSSTWLLDLGEAVSSDILNNLSGSHRRNIEKGSRLRSDIGELNTPDEVSAMQTDFPSSLRQSSRLVLDPRKGPVCVAIFTPTGALRWWVARVNGRCVATSVWLVLKDTAVYVDGASLRDDKYSGVNHHLFAHLLTALSHAGVRRFDFGGGPGGVTKPGLSRFKEGWGARAVERSETRLRRFWYDRLRCLRP